MLGVDQFLRLMSVPAVIVAFVVASQVSAALNPPPAMTMVSDQRGRRLFRPICVAT